VFYAIERTHTEDRRELPIITNSRLLLACCP
jgi:hypothetical protein